MKRIAASFDQLNLKQKNILGAILFLVSMLVICLFVFSLASDVVSFKYFPYVYLGLTGLYTLNGCLFDWAFGDKIPKDYFFKLGLSQRYMLPFAIVAVFLFFKLNANY